MIIHKLIPRQIYTSLTQKMSTLHISPSLRSFIKQNIEEPTNRDSDMEQLLLIQKQSDLISEIMKNIRNPNMNKKIYDEGSEFSLSTAQNSRHLSVSKSTFQLHHNQQNFYPQNLLEQALAQIKRYCSHKTFVLIRQKIHQGHQNRLENRLQKQLKYNQELMRRCLKLSHEVAELKGKLDAANAKLKTAEKGKLVKEQTMNLGKSEIFLKWEKSIVYKEKLQAELKKYLNMQFSMLEQEKKINEGIKQEIGTLLQKMETIQTTQPHNIVQLTKQIREILGEQQNLCSKQKQQYDRVHNELQSIFKELRDAISLYK